MPTITTGDPAAMVSKKRGDQRQVSVEIPGDRLPSGKQKTREPTERDAGMYNALGLALRGGIASLTNRVSDLQSSISMIESELATLSQRHHCVSAEAISAQINTDVVPPLQDSFRKIASELHGMKQDLPSVISNQMQYRFLTVEREIQNITAEVKQGRHLAEGLQNLHPLLNHLLTLLTSITQISQTFNRFHQSVSENLERQSSCTAKQERVLDRLQIHTKTIDDQLGQLVSLQHTMVSRINQSVQEAVSVRVATEIETMATQMKNTFTDALKERFSQLIPEVETILDERVAKLERSLPEGIVKGKAVTVPEEAVGASSVHTTRNEDLQRSSTGTEQDIPPDTSNCLAARRKRRISISSEPDCDLVTCLEVELPPRLAEHDLSIHVPAWAKLETQSNIIRGEEPAVLPGVHASPHECGDITVSRFLPSLAGSLIMIRSIPQCCEKNWNSPKERRKRRRLTLSPVLNGEHSLI